MTIVHGKRKISENLDFSEVPNKTSIYAGVSWKKDNKKWQAQLAYNKKIYYGGLFDNEEHAAMKVNLLCDKFEMERTNLMINIALDANTEK